MDVGRVRTNCHSSAGLGELRDILRAGLAQGRSQTEFRSLSRALLSAWVNWCVWADIDDWNSRELWVFYALLSCSLFFCKVDVKSNVEGGKVILSPKPVALQSCRKSSGGCLWSTPLKARFIQHQIRLFTSLSSRILSIARGGDP